MLHTGPKNMASMLGVLLCFRAHKYVINIDIKEMFLQFPIYESDRDFLAFLWHEDPKAEPAVCQYSPRLRCDVLAVDRHPRRDGSS